MTVRAEHAIGFEALWFAHEAVRGVAIAAPTHHAGMMGTIVPGFNRYEPRESTQELEEIARSNLTQEWGELSAQGPLDTVTLPFFLSMAAHETPVIATPTDAVATRLWTWTPAMTKGFLRKTSTGWFGNPETNFWKGSMNFLETLKWSGDATSSDGPQQEISGKCQALADVLGDSATTGSITGATAAAPVVITSTSHGRTTGDRIKITGVVGTVELNDQYYTLTVIDADSFSLDQVNGTGFTAYTSDGTWTLQGTAPSAPTRVVGPLMTAVASDLWIDDNPTAFGTTKYTAQLISYEFEIAGAVTPAYRAAGPAAGKTFAGIDISPRRLTGNIVAEFSDPRLYNKFKQDQLVNLRFRQYGTKIETQNATDFYYYVNVDVTTKLDFGDLGDSGGGRTIRLDIASIKNSTLGAGWQVSVQNNRTAI